MTNTKRYINRFDNKPKVVKQLNTSSSVNNSFFTRTESHRTFTENNDTSTYDFIEYIPIIVETSNVDSTKVFSTGYILKVYYVYKELNTSENKRLMRYIKNIECTKFDGPFKFALPYVNNRAYVNLNNSYSLHNGYLTDAIIYMYKQVPFYQACMMYSLNNTFSYNHEFVNTLPIVRQIIVINDIIGFIPNDKNIHNYIKNIVIDQTPILYEFHKTKIHNKFRLVKANDLEFEDLLADDFTVDGGILGERFREKSNKLVHENEYPPKLKITLENHNTFHISISNYLVDYSTIFNSPSISPFLNSSRSSRMIFEYIPNCDPLINGTPIKEHRMSLGVVNIYLENTNKDIFALVSTGTQKLAGVDKIDPENPEYSALSKDTSLPRNIFLLGSFGGINDFWGNDDAGTVETDGKELIIYLPI